METAPVQLAESPKVTLTQADTPSMLNGQGATRTLRRAS
jgi:hypothetical protein